MTNIYQARVLWNGAPVTGQGVSTFYAQTSFSGLPAALHDYFDYLKTLHPPGINWTVQGGGSTYTAETGDLVGAWSDGPDLSVASGGPGAYARGVGCRVVWNTGAVLNGRRVKGATFHCPLNSGAYQDDGTLVSTITSEFKVAADQLLVDTGGDLVVWTRPRPGKAEGISQITSSTVPDKVSWLRSRRT